MGIAEIGKQGQDFDPRVYDQIAKIKEQFPGLPIAVDGGVNEDNIVPLIEAGVSRLVVGSALWKSEHPIDTLKYMKMLASENYKPE
jgi:ribulose-phosphate 3-epimerase